MPSAPLATLVLFAALLGAAEPIELKEQPYDMVPTTDGRTLIGTVVEQRGDGTVLFKVHPSTEVTSISAGTYKEIRWRRPAAKVVAEAAKAAIAAKDQRRVVEVLRWGMEHSASEVVLVQAGVWLTQYPGDRDVLAVAVPLWRAKSDWAALEAAARAGIVADRNWSEGDELVVESLAAQGRTADLQSYARKWLANNPTALRANLICGASFEMAGDLRAACECFRKAWSLHKDPVGGLGLARTTLATGQFAEGLRTAQVLIEQKLTVPEARAYAAAAAAAMNELVVAKAQLQSFAADKLPAAAAQAGTYALGLIAYREGRFADAAKAWQNVPTLPAQLALAMAQRREFSGGDRLPAELRTTAVLLNASVRLENRQEAKALDLIDQHQDGRHGYLFRIAQVLASKGSAESVRGLGAVKTAESQRWQVFGHLIGGRFDEAEALARTLPASDGYAMVCRVYLAAAQGDPERARMLYEGSGGLPGGPVEYVRLLKELYDTAEDQQISEPFDWPAGEAMPSGWEAIIQGSGIAVHADAGKLIMEGTQTAQAADPVTRAVTTVSGTRFRLVRMTVDISALGQGAAGLELLDGARKNGVALAALGGRAKLHWRLLTAGRWSEWHELPYAVEGTSAVLALDFSGGRIFAADPTDPLRRTQLSDVLARAQGEWSMGLFGTAEAGVAYKVGFDDLRWRLKPER